MHNRDDVEAVAEERRATQLLADAERAQQFAENASRRRLKTGQLIARVTRLAKGDQAS